MHSKPLRTAAPARAPAEAAPTPWAWAADLSRQQSAVAAEGAAAVFRGLEAMRKIQEQTAQQLAQHHSAVVDRLRAAAQPVEVFAVQAELLRGDVESATRCWQQLAAAAMEMNTEILASTAQLIDADVVLAAAHGRLPS